MKWKNRKREKKEGRGEKGSRRDGEKEEERVKRVCAGGELTYYQILCHLTRTLMGHANQAAMCHSTGPWEAQGQ